MQKGKLIAEGTPSQLRSLLNGRILELRGSPLREMGTLVGADAGVEDVRLFGDQLHLRTLPGETGQVIKRLEISIPAAGYLLNSIRQVPANLEDIFILLSEKEEPEEETNDLPETHAKALKTLLTLIPPQKFGWVLTGSASLFLQGVDVPVHDLDIECPARDIRRIEKELAEYITTPVHIWESERIRSLDGKAQIGEVEIELISDLEVRKEYGRWTRLIAFGQKTWRECQGQQLPLFPLQVEAEAYQRMGREDKALLIVAALQRMKETAHD
jgi:hypothetical protein